MFALLLLLHGAALVAHHGLGLPYRHKAVFLFHFDFERNLPTLYSALLLAWAGWLSWRASRQPPGHPSAAQPRRDRLAWRALAAVFVFLAADEALALHEGLITPVGGWLRHGPLAGSAPATSPLLTFAWILPYGLLVGAFALCLFGWWRRLPSPTRRGIGGAAVLYLTGALALEAAGGWWLDGDLARRDLGYDLLVTAEEGLEMLGLLVFAAMADRFSSLGRPEAQPP